MTRKNIALIGLGFLLFAGFSGCSRSVVSPRFNDPAFNPADLRAAPSLLMISPDVKVRGFKKSYAALFKDSAALPTRLSGKILDSLKKDMPASPAPWGPDSALRSRLAETGSKYGILIHAITIEDTETELPRGILPGPTGGLEPAGGGIRKSCLVTFEVEIRNVEGATVHGFQVQAEADLPLYAYKTTLRNALDAAARKTAKHLAGK